MGGRYGVCGPGSSDGCAVAPDWTAGDRIGRRARVGLYAEVLFPWAADRVMSAGAFPRLRTRALAAARGEVVEVGFGSGLNLAHYPPGVTSLVAVEPSAGMLRRAAPRIAVAPFPVRTVGVAGERLPLPDASFDTAVCTFTLCTVEDPASVLAELRRVLCDDGTLLLVEHGLSPHAGVARVQRVLNPVQRVVACGCQLVRPVQALVEGAGFRFEEVTSFALRRTPESHGWITLGRAVKA